MGIFCLGLQRGGAYDDRPECAPGVLPVEDDEEDEKHEAPDVKVERALEHHREEYEAELEGRGAGGAAIEHLEEEQEEAPVEKEESEELF